MPLRRVLIACLLAVSWFSAALHSELEAVGWMFDHDHGHTHADAGTADQAPTGEDEHDSVFARVMAQVARVLAAPAAVILAAVCVLGVFAWLGFPLRLRTADSWMIPRRCEDVFPTSWQFVWRCAPESAAPQVLS
jgi:hypothetical protein